MPSPSQPGPSQPGATPSGDLQADEAAKPAAQTLSRTQELLLAFAAAAVTANAYYIHPIVGDVADSFGVSHAAIGLVPALNQLALALGIFLLLPLGDRYSNRWLTIVFATGQCIGMAIMTLAAFLAGGFALFTAGSTLLGFFTIAPYLLPAYASRRVAPERLGHVTAILTAGIIFGILIARVGAGIVAETVGWRMVYVIATAVMIAITIALPRIMEKAESGPRANAGSYPALVLSTLPLLRSHREIIPSGLIQGLGFGQFIALWLGLALHLTGPEMGYGTDVVGYLAGFSAISILSTPRLGRLGDRIGPRRARFWLTLLQVVSACMLWFFGGSLWLLMIPIFLSNLGGPATDVYSRMTFLSLEPELRTRLTTIYIVMMFIGGGVGSVAGTAVFDAFGWHGTAGYVIASSVSLCLVALYAWRRYGHLERAQVEGV